MSSEAMMVLNSKWINGKNLQFLASWGKSEVKSGFKSGVKSGVKLLSSEATMLLKLINSEQIERYLFTKGVKIRGQNEGQIGGQIGGQTYCQVRPRCF